MDGSGFSTFGCSTVGVADGTVPDLTLRPRRFFGSGHCGHEPVSFITASRIVSDTSVESSWVTTVRTVSP